MDDKRKLHAMMVGNGFERKPDEVITQARRERETKLAIINEKAGLITSRDIKGRVAQRREMLRARAKQNLQEKAQKGKERVFLGKQTPPIDQMLEIYTGAAFVLFVVGSYAGAKKVARRRRAGGGGASASVRQRRR